MLKEFDKLNPYTKYKKDIVLSLKRLLIRPISLSQKTSSHGAIRDVLEHIKVS